MRVLSNFLQTPAADPVPVLAYHFTGMPGDEEDAPYTLSTECFDAEMGCLVALGYRAISLPVLLDAVRGNIPWPKKAVVITFDDGRACVYEHALPIMLKHGVSATIFLLSSRIGRPNFLTAARIEEMQAMGFDFQSHGHDHRNFASLTEDQIKHEVTHSKQILDRLLRRPVSFFAYPYGGMNPCARNLLERAGYSGAVCSRQGLVTARSNFYELPRLGMRRTDSVETFVTKLSGRDRPGRLRRLAGGLFRPRSS